MVLRVGDTYFNKDGYPGTVVGRDPQKQAAIVEQKGETFEKARRYGFINGLDPKDREQYQAIVDQAKARPEAKERVDFLQVSIDELKQDPRKHVLARYLEGEMAHLMNSEGIYPRTYLVDETKT